MHEYAAISILAWQSLVLRFASNLLAQQLKRSEPRDPSQRSHTEMLDCLNIE